MENSCRSLGSVSSGSQTLCCDDHLNPVSFFIRELLLLLREEGKVLHGSQGWNAGSGVVELGITEGVREIVQRRVRRLSEEANHLLSEEANHLLSVGAAFNGAFSFEV